ncbi:MAG: glycosyltransferase family 39 protein [Anaerolineae bacterium]|nr:glycosyltransferase family 39 protein [Anaerolineae bacterium]
MPYYPALAVFALAHYALIGGIAGIAYLLGRRLTLGAIFQPWEDVPVCTTLGLGCLAYLMLALGLAGLFYAWAALTLLLLALLVCYPVWPLVWARRRGSLERTLPWLMGLAVVGVLGAPFLLLPLYPATEHDSTMYHLPYVKAFIGQHRLVAVPDLRYPVFPQTVELLYTLGMLLYDEIMAHLVQLLAMALVALLLFAWGRRVLSWQAGLFAVGLWFVHPLFAEVGASALIDVTLTLFVTAATYALWSWWERGERGWLVLAGVFAGWAAGTKYTGLVFVGLLGLAVVYRAWRDRRLAPSLVFALAAVLVASPWYVRTMLYTGDPLYPFLTPGRGLEWALEGMAVRAPSGVGVEASALGRAAIVVAQMGQRLGRDLGLNLVMGWQLSWQLPLEGTWLPWLVPPVALLLCLWAALVDRRLRGLLLLVGAYLVFWAASSLREPRFVLYTYPTLCLLVGVALGRIWRWLTSWRPRAKHVAVAPALVALLILPHWLSLAQTVRTQGRIPVTAEAKTLYLQRRLPSYTLYAWLNRRQGRDYTVYAYGDVRMTYFADGRLLGDVLGPGAWASIASLLSDSRGLYTALRNLGADYFLVPSAMPPVQDDFFIQHFQLVGGRPLYWLFRLGETLPPGRLGAELVRNPGFEASGEGAPAGWQCQGGARVVRLGNAHAGNAALSLSYPADQCRQILAVEPGALYRYQFYARAPGDPQALRLQVNWADAQLRLVLADRQPLEVGSTWTPLVGVLTAPFGASYAIILAQSGETGPSDWDDFSWQAVLTDP